MVLEEQIKAIADAGVTVIVAGGKFGDMALHYLNKYKIMGVRLMSKFDLRRLCKSVSATALPRLVSIYHNNFNFIWYFSNYYCGSQIRYLDYPLIAAIIANVFRC